MHFFSQIMIKMITKLGKKNLLFFFFFNEMKLKKFKINNLFNLKFNFIKIDSNFQIDFIN